MLLNARLLASTSFTLSETRQSENEPLHREDKPRNDWLAISNRVRFLLLRVHRHNMIQQATTYKGVKCKAAAPLFSGALLSITHALIVYVYIFMNYLLVSVLITMSLHRRLRYNNNNLIAAMFLIRYLFCFYCKVILFTF